MGKISSGIESLDSLIGSLYIGDNVVWEVDAGTSYHVFMQSFIKQSFEDSQKVIYVSFNKSPQSILNSLTKFLNPEHFILIDCFTSGKGKNDNTFLKFYENTPKLNIVRINNPKNIEEFSHKLNSIEDSFSPGVRYMFDSVTGMQDLWGDENSTYKFFTYMCPRLYDLGTVAYWMLEKDAHSQSFKANLRHITQVVIELYKKKDKLFLKALKLDGRANREAFKPHSYEIEDDTIFIIPARKEPSFDIGGQIKSARTRLGMSQKDLADKIGLTSSFISQIENNQISPSLSSFLQIAEALGINPTDLLQKEKKRDEVEWLFKKDNALQSLFKKEQGYSLFNIVSNDKAAAYFTVIHPGAELYKHFLNNKRDELIHVLKGNISVKIEDSEKALSSGDSIYVKHSLPSIWKNTSDKEVELLVVCI